MADEQGFVSVASTGSASDSTSRSISSSAASGLPAGGSTGGAAASADRGVAGQVVQLFSRSSHPTAALFHVLFKAGALLFYLLSGLFTDSFVMVFVVCVVLMAFDFWTVKNVTGRLMVGLRWWNDVAEDGTSTWRYESIDDPSQVSRADYAIFWYSLYLAGLSWAIFAFFALLKFSVEWFLVCGVSLVLIWSNVYGFWNCSSERARVEQSVQSAITQGTVAALTGKWGFGGVASSGGVTSASAAGTGRGLDSV
jgi:hypothetical protein